MIREMMVSDEIRWELVDGGKCEMVNDK